MATLLINGTTRTFDAPADMALLWVLRDILALTGTTPTIPISTLRLTP